MILKDLVLETIKKLIDNDMLFTALDVSNTVKKQMPYVRHYEVRDVVRAAWSTDIENRNYDRTAIQVTLHNGTSVEALLYHPLSASWDLDNLYDAQQRSQTPVAPSANTASTGPTTVQTVNGTLTKANDGTLTVTTTPVPPLAPPVVAPSTNPRDLWAQMWQNSPSLFPRK